MADWKNPLRYKINLKSDLCMYLLCAEGVSYSTPDPSSPFVAVQGCLFNSPTTSMNVFINPVKYLAMFSDWTQQRGIF
jgi:hypothetical protein